MALIEFNSSLHVGFPEIDKQHKKLVDYLNKLHDAMKAGKGKEVMGPILGELITYTVEHFAYEEGEMQKKAYPQMVAHKSEHQKLVTQVSDFKRKFDQGALVTTELMSFLKNWLQDHIQKSDKSLGTYLGK
jgi:hemerythrin-like metal-binding protein